ncbi:kinetochore protein NDC80 homolog [Venturia canescens]|uniref:kinetochore protein NDC80 homolog n=1 Tax=Venturia canescens TaxID=32260 RepID=UPI001C9C73C3|nr:kinetochore protein NDC80 homolog [Venturia canescens]
MDRKLQNDIRTSKHEIKMRSSSTGRSSAASLVRLSVFEREEKSAGRSEARRTQTLKPKGSALIDNSQIPRPRMRSNSSDRMSNRRSQLKITAKTPLSQPRHGISRVNHAQISTPKTTPQSSSKQLYREPLSGTCHRSPSAERASIFCGKGARKDTRPINDKNYQSTMLNKVDEYFSSISQSSLLNTNGSLRPVTLKIFIEATGCLLSHLDVKNEVSINNYMDECPKLAKKVYYPGTVTKSWLKTANTMHSWPHVLGWLSWLVEACEAKDLAERTFETGKLPFVGFNDEQETNRIILLMMVKCYVAWNEERLDDEAALEEQLLRDLNNVHGDIDTDTAEELETLEKENASCNEIDEKSKTLDEELNSAQEFLAGLKHNEKKENELIQSTENRIKRTLQEIKHLNHDSKEQEAKIQKENDHQKELLVLIEKQPMTVQERNMIIEQCSEVQSYIQQFDTHIKDIQNEVYALDMKLASSNLNLYKAILAYNKDIIMHFGCDTGVDLKDLKLPEENLLSYDFEVTLPQETAMVNLKENIKKQLNQMETLIEAHNTDLDSLEEKFEMLREKNKNHAEKMTEQKVFVQQIQQNTKEKEMKLKKQIKNIQSDIASIEKLMPDSESVLNELSECQDKLRAVKKKQQYVEKSLEQFFDQFYCIISKHKNNMAAILSRLPKLDG